MSIRQFAFLIVTLWLIFVWSGYLVAKINRDYAVAQFGGDDLMADEVGKRREIAATLFQLATGHTVYGLFAYLVTALSYLVRS